MALIEITTFRLADAGGDDAFVAADRRAQTGFVYQQPGLARRTTARGTDGAWLVLTVWASAAHADAAADKAHTDPAASAWRACIDPATVTTSRYETFD